MADINSEIRNPKGRVFRKLYVKRRSSTTGLFETNWQEITKDVKSWGRITKSIDHIRRSRVRFSDLGIVVANDYGKYNPETDESSLWNGYASQQRSLVKVEAGFIHQTFGSSGIWTNTLLPADPTVFVGVILGDIALSDSNEVYLPVKPLLQVFRDFATRNLSGLTTAGMTASQFIQTLRDQTDGSSNYIFRPFFGDTTSYWEFTSSAVVYKDVSTNQESARPAPNTVQNDFLQMNVWDAIEKLAEAEDMIPYITRDGKFKFKARDVNSAVPAFAFYGRGFTNRIHGTTLKRIEDYRTKTTDFYSRVEVKWSDLATSTAIVATQSSLVVGNNDFWNFGHRTYSVENYWLGTLTSAQSVANTVFSGANELAQEMKFTSSFVPHLEVLDVVTLNYDSAEAALNTRWDYANWAADNTNTSDDLIWAEGDALSFIGDEFKLTSIEIDLDGLECRFVGIKTGGYTRNLGGNTVGSAVVGSAILG